MRQWFYPMAGLVLLGLLSAPLAAQTYSWTDDEGNVHYGDSIPPEYRDQEQRTLRDGIEVDRRERAKTEEELEAERREEARREAEREARERQREEDERLMRLYGSVAEIERLRDDRVEGIQSQIRLTESNLEELEENLVSVEESIQRYRERDEEVPPYLVERQESLSEQVNDHQRHILERESQLERVRERFEREIQRFSEIQEERSEDEG
jgi:chromosome segregation ATPase